MAADLPESPSSRRFRFPLHVHISTLFFLLVLLAGGSIAAFSYFRSAEMLERAAGDLLTRIARQTVVETESLLRPVEASVSLLALNAVSEAGTLAERRAGLAVLREALRATPSVSAYYVGYASGDFFMLMRLADDADRRLVGAPAGAAYLIQSIAGPQGQFIYLDADLHELRADPRPDYPATYDPRQRSWYVQAQGRAEPVQTEPYLFASTRRLGVTVARRTASGRAVVGADIRLATLDDTLRRQRITPGSQLVLFDGAQRVVACSEPDWLLPEAAGGEIERPRVSGLTHGGVAALARQAPQAGMRADQALAAFDGAGRSWHGAVASLPVRGGQTLYLGVAIPDDELLTDARSIRDRAILVTVLVILLALPFTYGAARLVSRPIRELAREAAAIRRFDFADEVVTRSVVREVDDLARDLASMKGSVRRFLDIASVMAEEPDFERLLPRLVDETVGVVGARAGVLYLARDDGDGLDAVSVRDAAGHSLPLGDAPPGPAMASLVPEGERSGVGCSVGDIGGAGLFAALGARAMAYLAVPLLDRKHDRVGLLVLWFDEAPDRDLVHFVEALSGSAAVSVETRALIRAQKQLFEAFIQLIAGAIDAKSPYTGGHCARVPELTKMLARAACDATDGPYRNFSLDDEDWEAVHIAAWLHDCGKVTTPEYVVDKATKLETIHDRIHEIRMRFEVLKRDAEIACWQAVARGGDLAVEQAALAESLAVLDAEFAFVAACNAGGEAMDPADVARLQRIGARTWLRTLDDRLGVSTEALRRMGPGPTLPVREALIGDKPEHRIPRSLEDAIPADNPWGFRLKVPELLYNRGELTNLCIDRGTLTEEDRFKINEHIVQTIRMLSELPFPRHLRAVPEIAGGHHEKMDGSGYPRGLTREQMSPMARMMAIADIFEALTAVDRPYKKGKHLSEAIRIMARMRDAGHIDPELFALFLQSGVYRRYADRFMARACVDEVDVAAMLAPAAPGA
ncbi:HD domain-containing phosphohydrolase [Zoogloea sp.]|uniref:HD domain-containing phosphohydrolase n=1 Tax=Zoogloea sp. TaxID=49181 RepID=UPI0025F466B2|nr:HD domain-containing phosphohydrolase [Zoogloea sp.]MCK6394547.1 metal-dependent phosphohydrolase [Zoogloea sp.]